MDTNTSENATRPINLNRKSALSRATTRVCLASLIEFCKLHSIAPYAYLRATPEATTNGHPKAEVDDPCHGTSTYRQPPKSTDLTQRLPFDFRQLRFGNGVCGGTGLVWRIRQAKKIANCL